MSALTRADSVSGQPDNLADMSDAQLDGELRRLAALRDPATMGLHLIPGFQLQAHTRHMGRVLASVSPERPRIIITTPPRVGKSLLACELFGFWWLAARDSRARLIIASYAASLSLPKSKAVRRHIAERGGEFGLSLRRGDSNIHNWSCDSGGGIRATGVTGSLTGFDGDVAIVDDPHKDRQEAESPLMRTRVWEWWTSTLMSRRSPGAPVVLIMTRWHPDDLVGRVLDKDGRVEEGGKWTVVHLPAYANSGDPLGRAPGAPIPHPKIPEHDLTALGAYWEDKRVDAGARDWGALYLGDPKVAEGALLSYDTLMARRCSSPAEAQRRAVAVDPSGGGRDTAGIVAGYLGTDERLYLTHDRTGVMSSDAWSRAACKLAAETGAQIIYVERNYGGDMTTLAVRTAWDALQREGVIPSDLLPPYVQPVTARTGKLLRAEPIAQQWQEDRVRTAGAAGPLVELEQEWATWQPGAASPGRIDASVYLAYGLLRPPSTAQAISSPAGVSLSQAASSGRTGSGLGAVRLR
ncbi:terminase large subunit domain-containing protein [Streptomyces xiamenensis]|uniref:terminase large subunit domain-containing protein n=1 Tax=Streptomyces xiamenensis TaxID=408015 RepID=UPI003D73D485